MHTTTDPAGQPKRNLRLPSLRFVSCVHLLCVLALSAGCAGPPATSAANTPATSESPPAAQPVATDAPTALETAPPARSYLVEAGTSVPTSFNPLLPENDAAQRVVDNVFDSLLTINAETASLEPSLATQTSISEDDLTITFQLTADAQWHDGTTFTADDVEFTFDSILNTSLDSPYKADLVGIDQYYATDAHTFVVTLDNPDCSMLASLARIPIIPSHLLVVETEAGAKDIALIEDIGWEHPVGTGPFRFGERLSTGEVHLVRNDSYFRGAPRIDEWVYVPCHDAQEMLSGLREGGIDLARVSRQETRFFENDPNVSVIATPGSEYYALMINVSVPLLSDANTRKALAYAIDRPRLVQTLLDGYGQVVDSSWLPEHWANGLGTPLMDYNPARAKELLSEAGWEDSDGDYLLDRDGKPLNIDIAVNAENVLRKQIAFAVQQNWLEIGIAAEVHFVEFYALVEKLFSHTFEVAVFSWPMHPDPDQSLLWASDESELLHDFNVIAYANPAVDEALLAGLTAPSCDTDARARAYQQAIGAITADQPYIFLFAPQQIVAASRRLVGLRPGPYASLSWNITEWALEPAPQTP